MELSALDFDESDVSVARALFGGFLVDQRDCKEEAARRRPLRSKFPESSKLAVRSTYQRPHARVK